MIVTTTQQENSPSSLAIFVSSLLVLGNVLGVGVLALPISAGLGGFFPAISGIVLVWFIMMFASFVIVHCIKDNKESFDMPSFFKNELGTTAKWIAIACNLLILYGVLVAYLSGITTMLATLYTSLANYRHLVSIVYFCLVISLIVFGLRVIRRGMSIVMIILWSCFFVMCFTALGSWHSKLLTYVDWKFLPFCLPIAVSAFHFHNIIPTVSKSLNHDKTATYKAITIGLVLGLIINLGWVTVVLGTMPENGAGTTSITYAYGHSLTANVPMGNILRNRTFEISALIFALMSVTCSFMANGAGLFGFMTDICTDYFRTDNRVLVSTLAFAPPLVVALSYPEIFLSALSLVGGVGEDILFGLLPGLIVVKIALILMKKGKHPVLRQFMLVIGWIMITTSLFILVFELGRKFGFIHLALPILKM